MAAAAQVAADYTGVIPPSGAVSFFRALPRWPGAADTFDFSTDYLVPVALTALIPIIVAAVLALLLVLHITVRYTCRQPAVDARIAKLESSRRAAVAQIAFAAAITFLTAALIAVGLSSITALNFSAADGLDVIRAVLVDVARAGFAVVDTAIFVQRRIAAFSPGPGLSDALSDQLGDQLTPAVEAIQRYVLTSYPDVEPMRAALDDLVNEIRDVLDTVRRVTNIASGALVAIVLLLLSAPLLMFFVGAMPIVRRWRPCRILAHVLFLLVPALLSWVLVGLASGTGAVVSDVCVSVHEYRDVLLGNTEPSLAQNNALVKSNFTCPEDVDADVLQSQFNATVQSVVQNDLAETSLELFLNTSSRRVADAAEWTRDEVIKYADCSALQEFSGKLEFIVCGEDGHSAMESIFDLWVSFLGLALTLTAALVSSLFGVRVAWSLLVWPRDPIRKVVSLDDIAPGQRYDLGQGPEPEMPFDK